MQVPLNNLYPFAKISKLINKSNSIVMSKKQIVKLILHFCAAPYNLAPLKTNFFLCYLVYLSMTGGEAFQQWCAN